ncbi:MAG: UDP-3-O-acyl-N-acetylglucosamine deacetylase [Pararhodobacter sp.]|nr:UDP-3-O-acyl-N-acetylglucosamine deacetylase [Pararhodobacter sp.]
MQTTLSETTRFEGVALHSGEIVSMAVHPAPADSGIVFERVDIAGTASARRIRVSPDALVESSLCTKLVNRAGTSVSTIEHLMAALAGCGIHNARVTLDGGEVPILDGSARPFVSAFQKAGIRPLRVALTAIRVLRPVQVAIGPSWARLEPAPQLSISFEIDFPDAAIGRQSKDLALCNGTFVRELADSRTFCRQADVDFMRANGLALGGSYENAVVVDGARVLSPGGLRHADEPVRHKMLDALGDLAVAGAPILGRYIGYRAGHALTARLLRALMADPTSHDRVEIKPGQAHCLPGLGYGTEPAALATSI